jgi:predicted ATPase
VQTSFGRAVAFSRGFGSEDTRAAFTRAKNLATEVDNTVERFNTYYGLWVGSLVRGEFGLAREIAETFKREAEDGSWITEVGVASRWLGLTCLFQGDLVAAQTNLDHVLSTYDPRRDGEAKFRFGVDSGVAAARYLAPVSWLLGEAVQARMLMEQAIARATQTAHVMTLTNARGYEAVFEILRGDAEAARRTAEACIELSREHSLALYLAFGTVMRSWALSRLGNSDVGAAGLRQALETYTDQGNMIFVPLFEGLLAELEAKTEGAERALARIDGALTLANDTGEHWTDALLRRIRGEILLTRDPANTAPAEEAFLAAIATAREQKAKSFELRAALSLAKLYQSTNRAADADAVLTPALAGFSPTPEFPEIEEAHRLLTALAETDEVKNAAASRERRLKLQTAYANALIHARGHGAPETSAAFAKAQTLAAGLGDAADRFSAHYGHWVGSLNRGEPAAMQEAAAAFLRETELHPDMPEAGVAYRISGLTRLYFADYAGARANLEKSLAILDSERDRDLAFRFGQDQVAAAMIYMALVLWPLGDVERARQFADQAASQAAKSGNVQTLAYVNYHLCLFEALQGDRERASPVAKALLDIARERPCRFGRMRVAFSRAGPIGSSLTSKWNWRKCAAASNAGVN